MRIGIVVDGTAESQALSNVTNRIQPSGVTILAPKYANMQPKTTASQIARSAKSTVDILARNNLDTIVVLIDREDRKDCPGVWATSIRTAFHVMGYPQVEVVVKNRKFENWLVADPNCFTRCGARYNITQSFVREVSSNKADNVVDAEDLLNRIVAGKQSYHKNRDANQICQYLDIEAAALNSRSFRKFLRLLKHPKYADQSLRP